MSRRSGASLHICAQAWDGVFQAHCCDQQIEWAPNGGKQVLAVPALCEVTPAGSPLGVYAAKLGCRKQGVQPTYEEVEDGPDLALPSNVSDLHAPGGSRSHWSVQGTR